MEEKQKTPRGERKDFPLTTLIVAEDVAKAVNNAGGKISTKAISSSLGNIKGGALARKLAAAKRWGLIRGAGILEITPLGKKVVLYMNEEDLAKSRKEAFLTVPLLAELYPRFGNSIPPDQTFVAILAREYELTERDAKTMLTIYKEASKLYLGANIKEKVELTDNIIIEHKKPQMKKDGKLSICINSPMGDNNFKADNKQELKLLKTKLEKLFALIEDELPEDNNQPSPTAEASTSDLSDEETSG